MKRNAHSDRKPSFGFNVETGYGYCFRCGSMLARDVARMIGLDPADYSSPVIQGVEA
jgi:hypothetical protein